VGTQTNGLEHCASSKKSNALRSHHWKGAELDRHENASIGQGAAQEGGWPAAKAILLFSDSRLSESEWRDAGWFGDRPANFAPANAIKCKLKRDPSTAAKLQAMDGHTIYISKLAFGFLGADSSSP
jgi:hypothetical protein